PPNRTSASPSLATGPITCNIANGPGLGWAPGKAITPSRPAVAAASRPSNVISKAAPRARNRLARRASSRAGTTPTFRPMCRCVTWQPAKLVLAASQAGQVELVGLAHQLCDARQVQLVEWGDVSGHLQAGQKLVQADGRLAELLHRVPGVVLLGPIHVLVGEGDRLEPQVV